MAGTFHAFVSSLLHETGDSSNPSLQGLIINVNCQSEQRNS